MNKKGEYIVSGNKLYLTSNCNLNDGTTGFFQLAVITKKCNGVPHTYYSFIRLVENNG